LEQVALDKQQAVPMLAEIMEPLRNLPRLSPHAVLVEQRTLQQVEQAVVDSPEVLLLAHLAEAEAAELVQRAVEKMVVLVSTQTLLVQQSCTALEEQVATTMELELQILEDQPVVQEQLLIVEAEEPILVPVGMQVLTVL
jgi:nicotinate-nucleotide pyrophosphorylase